MEQLALFRNAPEGFQYEQDFLTISEEANLLESFERLSFVPYEYQEYTAGRLVAWMDETTMTDPVRGLRDRAEKYIDLRGKHLTSALVTKYEPGVPIGWHRDMPPYRDIVGVSLASSCTFRLRRMRNRAWDRFTRTLAPRSMYVMSGPARSEWQHSIPPVPALRYSITFRTI